MFLKNRLTEKNHIIEADCERFVCREGAKYRYISYHEPSHFNIDGA